jgi:hypothetical protein
MPLVDPGCESNRSHPGLNVYEATGATLGLMPLARPGWQSNRGYPSHVRGNRGHPRVALHGSAVKPLPRDRG